MGKEEKITFVFEQIEQGSAEEYEKQVMSLQTDLFAVRYERGLDATELMKECYVSVPGINIDAVITSEHSQHADITILDGNSDVDRIYYDGSSLCVSRKSADREQLTASNEALQTLGLVRRIFLTARMPANRPERSDAN